MSNLLAAAKARDLRAKDWSVEVLGSLADAPQRFAAVEMRVNAPGLEKDPLNRLVAIAEKGCIVANTICGVVTLNILVV